MKLTRLLALLTCLMTLAFFSGCTQKYQHDETGLYSLLWGAINYADY